MPLGNPDPSALGNYVIVANVGARPVSTDRYPGKLIWQADVSSFFWWDGATWQDLSTSAGGAGLGGYTFVVASSTASATIRARADLLCDGTSDESQINAMLALGNVQLTDGDYNIASPIVMNYPGHSLSGTGFGADMTGAGGGTITRGYGTRLLLSVGFVGAYGIDVQQTGATRPAGKVTIRDLTVDGAGNGTAVDGIHFRSFQFAITDVEVRQMTGHGINLHGYSTAEIAVTGWATYDSRIQSVHCENNGGSGLYFANGTDVQVTNCVFNTNGSSGFHHDGGASVQMTNVHCYGNTINGIHLDGAGSRDKFANMKIEHNGQHGFHFNGVVSGMTSVQIVNSGFNSNGQTTNNTYSHIKFTGAGASARASIIGCNFGNPDSATNLAKYCLDLGSVAGELLLVGNNFGITLTTAGVATDILAYSGTPTVVAHSNVGLRDHTSNMTAAGGPTAVAGGGAGTTPPAPVISGNDTKGQITWGTGTGTPTNGTQVSVTYELPIILTGWTVILTPMNDATALLRPRVGAATSGGWTIMLGVASAASQANTVYGCYYVVIC